jgi:hypothetical protein
MLGQCIAYLVAHAARESLELANIARRSGFSDIRPIASSSATEHQPSATLGYFLVHHHLGQEAMKKVLKSIRASPLLEVRFAPVILFALDGPFEVYLEFIKIGFDDVITLPEKRPVMVDRLMGQIGGEQAYFETSRYLGPDRRRMEVAPPAEHDRAKHPHSHVRHYFRRHVYGIEYLRREEFLPHGHMVHVAS